MQLSSAMSPRNRTGMQASPIDSKAQLDVPPTLREPSVVADTEPQDLRNPYIIESEGLGSVPPPATAKGMAKAGLQALAGNRAQLLMDKIAERLAFERAGARLYEQLITKCEALAIADDGTALPPIAGLRDIHGDEVAHAQLLKEAMEHLGGDPTAQTPCADLVGVQGMGLLQTLSDARTTPAQCLHALLTAELTDNAGWELLSILARKFGQEALAQRFDQAHASEARHLDRIKAWHTAAVLGETSVLASVDSALSKAMAEGPEAESAPPARGRQVAAAPHGAQSPVREDRKTAVNKAAHSAQEATPARHPRSGR